MPTDWAATKDSHISHTLGGQDCINLVPSHCRASTLPSGNTGAPLPGVICSMHAPTQSYSPTITLLQTRRSLKPNELTGPGPSPADLDTLLTIASRVPDHGKLAPWRFIVFEGDARLRAGEIIAKVFAQKNPQAAPSDIEAEKKRLTDAPLVIAVVSFTRPHPKVPAWEQELSAGASAMNIVTAATALGYGACWLTGWFAFDRDVLDGFGLKADEKLAGFVHIGTPSKPSEDRPRPALSEIVTRF